MNRLAPRRFLGNTMAEWFLIATASAAFDIFVACVWSSGS